MGSKQTSQRTKHIDMRFYYSQDKISNKTIAIEYSSIDKMIADNLTKAFATENSHNSEIES